MQVSAVFGGNSLGACCVGRSSMLKCTCSRLFQSVYCAMSAIRIADCRVGAQVATFVFDRSPQALDEYVVSPGVFAVRG